jgi:hypothetical protein
LLSDQIKIRWKRDKAEEIYTEYNTGMTCPIIADIRAVEVCHFAQSDARRLKGRFKLVLHNKRERITGIPAGKNHGNSRGKESRERMNVQTLQTEFLSRIGAREEFRLLATRGRRKCTSSNLEFVEFFLHSDSRLCEIVWRPRVAKKRPQNSK